MFLLPHIPLIGLGDCILLVLLSVITIKPAIFDYNGSCELGTITYLPIYNLSSDMENSPNVMQLAKELLNHRQARHN